MIDPALDKASVTRESPFKPVNTLQTFSYFDVYACTKPTATEFDDVRGANIH